MVFFGIVGEPTWEPRVGPTAPVSSVESAHLPLLAVMVKFGVKREWAGYLSFTLRSCFSERPAHSLGFSHFIMSIVC